MRLFRWDKSRESPALWPEQHLSPAHTGCWAAAWCFVPNETGISVKHTSRLSKNQLENNPVNASYWLVSESLRYTGPNTLKLFLVCFFFPVCKNGGYKKVWDYICGLYLWITYFYLYISLLEHNLVKQGFPRVNFLLLFTYVVNSLNH